MSRLTFTLEDPDNPEAETSLTVTLGGDEVGYQVDAFRRFLLAQQFAPETIDRAIGEQHYG